MTDRPREAAQAIIDSWDSGHFFTTGHADRIGNLRAALADPEVEQEPVARMDDDGHLEWNRKSWMDDRYFPVYRRPPRREWKGLTDEERQQILGTTHPDNRWTLAERVEYRLKEKNA